MRHFLSAAALVALWSAPAQAAPPRVLTDIAPVQSLVAMVMGDLGTVDRLLPDGASPHSYALRPSEARTLGQADMLIWVGAGLTPWLERVQGTLAPGAVSVQLAEAEEGEHDDHAEDHDDHEDHQGHEGEDAHEDHQDHDGDDAHEDHLDHDDHDPHLWLDPAHGRKWLKHIALRLSEADPENAVIYHANAALGQAEIAEVVAEVEATLKGVDGSRIWAYHDAYGMFDAAFGVKLAGALTRHESVTPGARKLRQMLNALADEGGCLILGPSDQPDRIANLGQGLDLTLVMVDPLGSDQVPGATLYPAMLRGIGKAIASCEG